MTSVTPQAPPPAAPAPAGPPPAPVATATADPAVLARLAALKTLEAQVAVMAARNQAVVQTPAGDVALRVPPSLALAEGARLSLQVVSATDDSVQVRVTAVDGRPTGAVPPPPPQAAPAPATPQVQVPVAPRPAGIQALLVQAAPATDAAAGGAAPPPTWPVGTKLTLRLAALHPPGAGQVQAPPAHPGQGQAAAPQPGPQAPAPPAPAPPTPPPPTGGQPTAGQPIPGQPAPAQPVLPQPPPAQGGPAAPVAGQPPAVPGPQVQPAPPAPAPAPAPIQGQAPAAQPAPAQPPQAPTTSATTTPAAPPPAAPLPPAPPPGAAPVAPAPAPAAPGPVPVTLPGTVQPHLPGATPLVTTPAGTVALQGMPPLPAGAAVLLEVTGVQLPAAAPQPAGPAAPPLAGGPAGVAFAQAMAVLSADDPEAAGRLAATLPGANARMLTNVAGFAQAAGSGQVRAWVGGDALRALDRAGPRGAEAARKLGEAVRESATVVRDGAGAEWRSLNMPFGFGGTIDRIQIITRRQRGDGDEEEDGVKGGGGQRFLIHLDLSRLGPLQLDGLYKKRDRRLDLIVRTHSPLPDDMRRDIAGIFATSAQALGLKGGVTFHVSERFAGPVPDAPPARPGLMV